MTGRRSLARRYAVALAELAQEKGLLDDVERGLAQVRVRLEEDPALRECWYGVGLSPREKVSRLREALGSGVPALVYQFLGVVASKGREGLLGEMDEQFRREADRLRHVFNVDVEAAYPLSESDHAVLKESLAQVLKARGIRLSVRVNPELIGGLVVRAGDLRIDGSLIRQLGELRERLRSVPLDAALVSFDGKAG